MGLKRPASDFTEPIVAYRSVNVKQSYEAQSERVLYFLNISYYYSPEKSKLHSPRTGSSQSL
jgi:hypothetical protein